MREGYGYAVAVSTESGDARVDSEMHGVGFIVSLLKIEMWGTRQIQKTISL
jgi:hypothetical protein